MQDFREKAEVVPDCGEKPEAALHLATKTKIDQHSFKKESLTE